VAVFAHHAFARDLGRQWEQLRKAVEYRIAVLRGDARQQAPERDPVARPGG
jgi:hypothetical protein